MLLNYAGKWFAVISKKVNLIAHYLQILMHIQPEIFAQADGKHQVAVKAMNKGYQQKAAGFMVEVRKI